jgi:hypothetical protein
MKHYSVPASLGAVLLTASIFVNAQMPALPRIGGPPPDAPPPKAVPAGQYQVTVATDPSLRTHTIYRPTDLKAVKGKLPIVAWGNGGTFRQPNGGWFAEVGTAWLSWQLKGNKTAARMFHGDNCGLCIEPAWKVKKKNMK